MSLLLIGSCRTRLQRFGVPKRTIKAKLPPAFLHFSLFRRYRSRRREANARAKSEPSGADDASGIHLAIRPVHTNDTPDLAGIRCMALRGVNRVMIAVHDMEKAKQQYTDLLGATFLDANWTGDPFGISVSIAWDAGIELRAPLPGREKDCAVSQFLAHRGEGPCQSKCTCWRFPRLNVSSGACPAPEIQPVRSAISTRRPRSSA